MTLAALENPKTIGFSMDLSPIGINELNVRFF